MYRSVDTKMWSDPKFKALSPSDKLLFIYLFTNQHAHLSGIYYLPPPVVQYETGLSDSTIKKGMDTLSIGYLIRIDTHSDVVWVVNMLKYQSKSDKIMRAVASQLESLHKCPLIKDFLRHYDTLSIPYRYPIDILSVKEQEQEQEQIQDKDQEIIARSPEGRSEQKDVPVFIEIVLNDKSFYPITEKQVLEFQEYYPAVDVRSELRKCAAWSKSNPKKRKTKDGILRHVNFWLSKQQDNGGSKTSGYVSRSDRNKQACIEFILEGENGR